MVAHDADRPVVTGDGFVTLADGSRRWGRFGAAGVLARHLVAGLPPAYFVARRSLHCHLGGTWAVPGGALHLGEDSLTGALREFTEETGVVLDHYRVAERHEDDHGGWSYTTWVLDVDVRFDAPHRHNWETDEVRWVSAAELHRLELLGAFRATLHRLGIVAG